MPRLEFQHDDDFDCEQHRSYRDDGWIGGAVTEVRYFVSCLTRTNYFLAPMEVWEAAARRFVTSEAPQSGWITKSNYFHYFAVLVLKDLYRASSLGKRHPIRKERRDEWVARNVLPYADLSIDQMAIRLKTTAKQLNRNRLAKLALNEYKRLTPDS